MDSPVAGLLLDQSATMSTVLGDLLGSLLIFGDEFISMHREASKESELQSGFWSGLALDLLSPVDQDAVGSQSLSGMLSDSRLGFTDNLWINALQDSNSIAHISNVMSHVSRVEQSVWFDFVDQGSDLLPRLNPLLSYMDEKAIWKGEGKGKITKDR